MHNDDDTTIGSTAMTVFALRLSPATLRQADRLIARLGALGLGEEHSRSTLLRLALRYGLAEIEERLSELDLGGRIEEGGE